MPKNFGAGIEERGKKRRGSITAEALVILDEYIIYVAVQLL